MFAGITMFILLVLLSPLSSKYYFIAVARQAVSKSLIVTLRFFAAAFTSFNRRSDDVPTNFLPVSAFFPSFNRLISYLMLKCFINNLGK